MINYTHNEDWHAEFDKSIQTTLDVMSLFGAGNTQTAPKMVLGEVNDPGSEFHKFLEVFYDETLLDAEVSYAAELAGEKEKIFFPITLEEKMKETNLNRFNEILNLAMLIYTMDGSKVPSSVYSMLQDYPQRILFLNALYEDVMFITRTKLIEENKSHS